MEIDEGSRVDACILYVLDEADHHLTIEEIAEGVANLTVEQQLDAICRYQESDPNP